MKGRYFLAMFAAVAAIITSQAHAAPQPLHLCVPPEEPIEDAELLAGYGMVPRDEYSRYFDELNAYLICLQKSQADIIEKGRTWHARYKELFGN